MRPLAFLGPSTAFSSEICGALGSTEGLQGGPGGGRAPLPCAVPLVPAARAALGRFYTTHPAAGLVGGQSLHHVQAVGLCPPVQAERGEAAYRELLTGSELSLLHPATEGTSPASTTDPSVLPVLSSSPANGDTGPTGHTAYLYQGLTCVPETSAPPQWG